MAIRINNEEAKKRFLFHFARHGIFLTAAAQAGKHRNRVYEWLDEKSPTYDEKFKADFEDCKRQLIEKLEFEADRRAVEGIRKPVFYKGQIVGETWEYSDRLLMFRLKALDPEKYGEHASSAFTGKDGRPLFMDLLEELRGLKDGGEEENRITVGKLP
jgi:hypothetical protein